MTYLIWSNEHHGWWKPDGGGYTKSKIEAGQYTLEQATQTCLNANCWHSDGMAPDETIVPWDDHWKETR